MRRKLLEEGPNLTLAQTLEIAEQCENVNAQMAALSVNKTDTPDSSQVSWVSQRRSGTRQRRPHKQKGETERGRCCYRCGRTGHYRQDPDCPVQGKVCDKCGGKDHFAPVRKTKAKGGKKTQRERQGRVNMVNIPVAEAKYAFVINDHTQPMVKVIVGKTPLSMLVNSGASTNIVSAETWEDLKRQGIICMSRANTEKRLYTYGSDTPLKVKGTFTCDVECGQHKVRSDFQVIEGNGISLLGRGTATELGVLNTGMDMAAVSSIEQNIRNQYPQVFRGVGKLNTHQVSLHIREEVDPVAQTTRHTPFNLWDRVQRKIQELLEADVIELVPGGTRWS